VAFALQNNPTHSWQIPGLATEYVAGLRGESAKFDLAFTMIEFEGQLRARVDYAAALFDPETIARMAAHFRTLLSSIVADPQQAIGRLPLVDADHRRRILEASRGAVVGYPDEASIPALFEAEAARRPDAPAIVDGDATLTYGELNARANQLAHWLRERAPQLPPRIGVCLERGRDLVIAMLGILKAGAAYMPLDPALPRERLMLMQDDAALSLVVTDLTLLPLLPRRDSAICMDRDAPEIGKASTANPESSVRADDVAYVIYTSGSTGTPKGVVVRHRSVVNLVRSADYATLSQDEVIAQIANPAFDAATFEVWGALLHGARLAIVPRDVALSPTGFAAYLAERGITTLFLTTALFNQVARDAPTAFAHCHNVLWGGEAAEPRHVAAVLAAGAPRRLSHVYGPTETTTFATYHDVRAVASDATNIPIGRAIANAEVYVLDSYGEPCPPDVPGEIFIGGPGVAAGYLGRPELTAERFVAHPFSGDPDARLYRTGDVARRRGDGAIEFLGRADRQLKIRGHRIEPGEIEAALARIPGVREAIVLMHGSTSDDKRLSAYVVPANPTPPNPDDLWRELRSTLPDYMVPGAFVFIAAIPLTPNGKVDRTKLPDPKDLAEGRIGWHVPPADPTQQLIAAIWEDLLGVKNIGRDDNFFDRGGHSLLAARMVDRVASSLNVEIPLATLFTHATLDEFSRAIRDESLRTPTPFVAINMQGERPPIFFLHGDFSGGGFFSKAIAAEIGSEWPFYALHPHGLLDDNVPDTIEQMALDRLAILRAERPSGPYVLGGHCAGGLVAIEMARRLLSEGEKVPLVFIIDARAPWQVKRVFEGISIGPVSQRTRRRLAEPPPPEEPQDLDGLPDRDIFRRYWKAMRTYSCTPYPGAIAVMRAEGNPDTRPSLGWSSVSEQVSVHAVPGNHHTAITRHVKALGAALKARLEAIDRVT
jgi:amino acid adenylation domain-containing protein